MSSSLARVEAALQQAGAHIDLREMPGSTRTAQEAAEACGCTLDQIAKSIVFKGLESGTVKVFLTAGGNLVCADKASAVAGEPLGKADAALIRAQTGFAIGGVSPVGHLTPSQMWFDPRLLDFDHVWAAAGTPRHVFGISPQALLQLTGAALADFTRAPAPS